MSDARVTLQSAAWAITGFFDAAIDLLTTDTDSDELRAYFYAVTTAGWRQLATAATGWMGVNDRPLVAYVGTDHALTDPDALDEMLAAGVDVRVMRRYRGVYHPKVFWFVRGPGGHLLAGSNNLTLDGLKRNIEFATLTAFDATDADLESWHGTIEAASDVLTAALLASYRKQRATFERRRVKSNVPTFTWRHRSSGSAAAHVPEPVPTLAPPLAGDLIVEITPRETGADGRQIQIPSEAAGFFGLGAGIGASVTVSLRNAATRDARPLTMTRFPNRTTRFTIRELDPRDRPCVMVFRRRGPGDFEFEVVQESADPTRYRALMKQCVNQTRAGSRRWVILTA